MCVRNGEGSRASFKRSRLKEIQAKLINSQQQSQQGQVSVCERRARERKRERDSAPEGDCSDSAANKTEDAASHDKSSSCLPRWLPSLLHPLNHALLTLFPLSDKYELLLTTTCTIRISPAHETIQNSQPTSHPKTIHNYPDDSQ